MSVVTFILQDAPNTRWQIANKVNKVPSAELE